MKVLVTGGSGFIGGTIANQLAHDINLKITATGRVKKTEHLDLDRLEYLPLHLTDDLPDLDHDICIHCAGLADDKSSKDALMNNNVKATENLIRHLKQCKIFIFISSASVYDFKAHPIAREEDASSNANLSIYGRSKLMAEEKVQNANIKSIYILRPRAVYGANDRILLPKIQERFKKGRIIIPGDLKVKSSLTHVDNIVKVIKAAIKAREKGVSIYNVADKDPYLLRDVFSKIGLIKATNIKFVQLPLFLVRAVVSLCNSMKIPISLSHQSIDYISLPSTLDTTQVQKSLGVNLESNLDSYLVSVRKVQ